MKNITKEEIQLIPALRIGFDEKRYAGFIESFIQDVNNGKNIEIKKIMHYLISTAVEYCGVSYSYRTIAYDFAWKVLESDRTLWNQKELDRNYCHINEHWTEFYPEDQGKFDDYDVATLNEAEYFVMAMDMILDNEIEIDDRPLFSYAIYLFFNGVEFCNTDEEIKLQFKDLREDEN